MGTSEKRINTCAGGTGAAGDWESAKPEGLFLAVLPYVSWQRAKDVAIRERSSSAEHMTLETANSLQFGWAALAQVCRSCSNQTPQVGATRHP